MYFGVAREISSSSFSIFTEIGAWYLQKKTGRFLLSRFGTF